MSRIIRIGTRGSTLALWQAHTVKDQLALQGYKTDINILKADGDKTENTPLYEFGSTGIFTRVLDTAMHTGAIDIAVHSMKDVPTILPKGITEAAVLERGYVEDLLIYKNPEAVLSDHTMTIATGSLRRKAQWLHRYPHHHITGLRGNVNTRLKKLKKHYWDGAIFARAGLDRLHIKPETHLVLDWMLPAPAQGAILVVAMENDHFALEALAKLNHKETAVCTHIEREFLRELEGGCTAPIGALATVKNDRIYFKGVLHSLDGTQKIDIEKTITFAHSEGFGNACAQEILQHGGSQLMQQIKAHITQYQNPSSGGKK